MSDDVTFTQDQLDMAAQQESLEKLKAENKHLSGRVVLLRTLVNHLQSSSKETQNTTKEESNDGNDAEDLGAGWAGSAAADGDGNSSGDAS